MRAVLLLRDKKTQANGSVVEMVVWKLPSPTPDRPHGLKYRFFCGREDQCLVLYDNETGKGDHRHFKGIEEPYRFTSVDRLIGDFLRDVESVSGG
ncbi:MAG: hypothetical protein HYR98_08550 [Nitrospirae bacterium]|nr:hypothetical protein [Nitrospirota bacterium]MBI3392383.1 hypothetical protein [Nitrospirota bacterium]